MKEDETPRGSSGGWELRWGHIGLAILVIGVLIVAWTVYRGSTASRVDVSTNCSGAVINGKCISSSSKSKSVSGKTSSSSTTSSKSKSSTTTEPLVATTSGGSATKPVATTSGGSAKALSNTGPGNTIGLFIFTAIIGVIAYQLYLRRRFSKEFNS